MSSKAEREQLEKDLDDHIKKHWPDYMEFIGEDERKHIKQTHGFQLYHAQMNLLREIAKILTPTMDQLEKAAQKLSKWLK